MIAHGHEAVPGNFQKLRRKPVMGQGDKIKQIPRVNQKCPHFVGKGRAFPKIPFRAAGILPLKGRRPLPGQGLFPGIVVRVRPGNVRIRYVQYPKGLLGPDFQFRCHIMKGLHGFFLPIWHVQHYNLFL